VPTDFALPTSQEYIRFLPEIILTLGGILLMVLAGFAKEGETEQPMMPTLSMGVLLAALAAAFYASTIPGDAFNGMLLVDGFATFFRILVLIVGILTVFASTQYLRRERAESGEFHALLLFSIVGQCILASANELMMVFIGLEISSIASYILAGYLRDDKRNNESALKYFLLGSFATAFLLYGIAWIYGVTRTTNLAGIREAISATGGNIPIALVGAAAALLFVGFAFKISVVPFQIWAPDVYQGAPAPVSAFLSAGPKAAAFAVFVRVFVTAFEPISARWQPIVWVCALLTMIVGNFAALTQTNIKRLLAYSSIAHAGYILVAVTALANSQGAEDATAAVMFYLAAYAFMNIGAFAVVTHVARKGEKHVDIDDLAGLGQRQPAVAAMFTIFLLSLIGVPLTAGFFGKFYIFKAALDAHLVWLTVLGLLNSAVGAYYYLKILVVMYMNEPGEAMRELPPVGSGVNIALWLSAVATLVLGIFPGLILDVASRSANIVR
jgi:NADH-quinone oxidoreductase subunit N